MPIAFIFGAFPAPSETFLRREVEALRALGLDVRAFAWRAGEGALPLPETSSLGSKLARRARGEAWWAGEGARWARACKRYASFEIEHIHATWASFPSAWALGAARELGVPWSFAAHARDLWVEGGDLRRKLDSAAFATACTQAGAERLRQVSPRPERVLYAPHGLPLADWPLRQPSDPEHLAEPGVAGEPGQLGEAEARPFQILSVGRLVPKKGLDILLRALAAWRSQAPTENWQAAIVGDGPERMRLELLRDSLKLQRRVRFVGVQTGEQVRDSMLAADAFVLPCRVLGDGDRDGLPNVLLEAAATGLPMIVGDAGSVRDLCDDSPGARNAWLFPPNDAGSLQLLLAQAHRELFASRGQQNPNNPWLQAAERARHRVEADFDIKRNIVVLAGALAQAQRSG